MGCACACLKNHGSEAFEDLEVQEVPFKDAPALTPSTMTPTPSGYDEHEGDRDHIADQEWQAMQATVNKYFGVGMSPVPEVVGRPSSTKTKEVDDDEEHIEEQASVDPFEAIREGAPLYTLSEELRADKEVVLAAIAREGAFCYDYIASPTLKRADRDVVLALVDADGSLLEHASLELRGDRQIVRIAVRTCSQALKFASKALQADRELKAVANSRAKEEQRLMKQLAMKACAPACFPH
jgi:hypothetical protein